MVLSAHKVYEYIYRRKDEQDIWSLLYSVLMFPVENDEKLVYIGHCCMVL